MKAEPKKSLETVLRSVADSPEKLRPCDAWRLYDTAQTAGCLLQIKDWIRATNPAAYSAMMEYESEEATQIHQPYLCRAQ